MMHGGRARAVTGMWVITDERCAWTSPCKAAMSPAVPPFATHGPFPERIQTHIYGSLYMLACTQPQISQPEVVSSNQHHVSCAQCWDHWGWEP